MGRPFIGSALVAALLATARPGLAAEPRPTSANPVIEDLKLVGVAYGTLYEGQFENIASAFCDPGSGEIYVTDRGKNLIAILDSDGSPQFAFTDNERLTEPFRAVPDRRGRIFVLDGNPQSVKIYSYRGDFLGLLDVPGVTDDPAASFTALAFDAQGNLYLGNTGQQEVVVVNPQRKVKLRFGTKGTGKGQFSSIVGIVVDDRNIYVSDLAGLAVQIFDRGGRFVRGWGVHDVGGQNVSLPKGIALDKRGRVVIVDALRQEIKVYEQDGSLAAILGGFGPEPGQVNFPSDVSTDALGNLCVADTGNRRVQILAEVEQAPQRKTP